jgi:hypothetical protein
MKNRTLVLTRKQETILEQIYNEMLYSLRKTWSEEKLFNLSCLIIKDCGIKTYQSKKEKTFNLIKASGKLTGKVFDSTKNKINLYRENGFKNELRSDSKYLYSAIEGTPGKLENFSRKTKTQFERFNEEFLKKSKEEKINLMASGLMSIFIFYASAGGKDFEGGIPDLDLELGIGYHRNIFSHSIISGFVVEFLMRAGVEILSKSHSNLPDFHHKFWDHINNFIEENQELAIGSMWAGISIHLLQDANLTEATTKPYTGIPFEMSMEAHQGLYTANGTASAIYAKN